MSRLTELQRRTLAALPDSLCVGLPAATVAYLMGVPYRPEAARISRLMALGYATREKPNEEWPFVYASTPAGREALLTA